ncbi:MAG TPA: class I SAM-dependent methyltransferase [Nocardioidaceae bacterium]|nr:class I SAM-dependent methyltransferase [Nocardioidaceae bacterium]
MSLSEQHAHDAPSEGFDHGAVSRFNAWFFTAFDRYINYVTRAHKQAAFGDLRPGTVLEIGAGVGANIGYLPAGTELVALEPSLSMHAGLERRCAAAGVPVTVIAGGAEDIPLPDASVDEVICSLVLCTAQDPARVLAEVRRVLRPGGRFRFVEHVAAPEGSPRRALQRLLHRPWAWVFEGCSLHRRSGDLVAESGFERVHVEQRRLRRSVFFPVNSAIWGVAHA